MFNFFQKNKNTNVSENESITLPQSEEKLKKQSILDILEDSNKTYDNYITSQLLNGLDDFRNNTSEFDHYRKEILDILNSEDGERRFYEELGKTINKD